MGNCLAEGLNEMRVQGWQAKLGECIEEARRKPYEIGRYDCLLFSLHVVDQITGIDYGKPLRGRYHSRISSLRLIKEFGRDLKEATTNVLGTPPQDVVKALRGDPMLYVDGAGVEHLGICISHMVAVLGAGGLIFISRNSCECCWNV